MARVEVEMTARQVDAAFRWALQQNRLRKERERLDEGQAVPLAVEWEIER